MSVFDTKEELEIITKAKKLIMHKYNMSESEAYHYIQRTAMNNKLRKIEIAQQILELNNVK